MCPNVSFSTKSLHWITEVDPENPCDDTTVCVDPNSACVDGTCQCNDGYVLVNGTCTMGICFLCLFVCFL